MNSRFSDQSEFTKFSDHVIRAWNVLAVGKTRMLLGQGNVTNQDEHWRNAYMHNLYGLRNKDLGLTYRLSLFVGRGSNSICCKISNFLFNISKNLTFFWECKDLEILRL